MEQIQYQYGIDANDDGLAEQFVSATNVTDWDEVIAVRIDMLVRTPNEDDQYPGDNTNYTLASGTVDNGLAYTVPTAAKKFRRKQFTKVVQIRNRIRY